MNLLTATLLLAPAVVALIVMRIIPMVFALVQSFEHQSFVSGAISFAGVDNYGYLLTSPGFYSVVVTTLVFNVVVNPLVVVLSTALALLLSQRVRFVGLWRAMIFVPAAVPGAVAALIWSTALQPDGLVNAALKAIGLPPQPFLTSSRQALVAIGIMVVWGALGYWMLFLIAGLKDIPESLTEAAIMDGAGWWRRLFSITLPLLRRPMAFVLIACTVGNFLVFAPIQILTQGGPAGSTNMIMYNIYYNAYQIGDLGTAQAQVVLLLLLLSVIVAIQFRLTSERDA